MTDLTKNTTAFGLLDYETRKALEAHGGPYEQYSWNGEWVPFIGNLHHVSLTSIIRVKPAPLTKDIVPWDAIAEGLNWFARDKDGDICVFSKKPSIIFGYRYWKADGICHPIDAFAGFIPGTCDWRESLQVRPGHEGDE